MDVTVILPPDYIGASEILFTIEVSACDTAEALATARAQLEIRLPEKLAIPAARTLSIGDVLIVDKQCHIIELVGFRPISGVYCENWRRRSLVERLIGSGEYKRIRANHSCIAPGAR